MTQRRAGLALLAALVVSSGLLVGASPAQACLCGLGLRGVDDRTVVFVATAGAPDVGARGRRSVSMAVEAVHQGVAPAVTSIATGSVGFSCSANFALGTTYLVVAGRGDDGSLSTDACSGSRPATPDTRERAAQLFGPPRPPLPDPFEAVRLLFAGLLGP